MGTSLHDILTEIKCGALGVDDGVERLRNLLYMDLGHTKFDVHRALRMGFPEVVYGEGKSPEQVGDIFIRAGEHANVLATRVSPQTAEYVWSVCPDAVYTPMAGTLTLTRKSIVRKEGEIAIITAGTSDLAVAEEARVTCEMLGSGARIFPDVGVAGIHRLLDKLDEIRKARVLIVVAGMEGALVSVIGGLVSQPVVAVPTSVGYGASFSGLSALLGMLTSCASGVTVVNIDNGFGAACAACRINNL